MPRLPAKRRQWPDHLRSQLMQCFSTGSPRCPPNKGNTQRASLLLLAYLSLTPPASDKKAPVCGAFPLMQEDAFDTAPALLLENQNSGRKFYPSALALMCWLPAAVGMRIPGPSPGVRGRGWRTNPGIPLDALQQRYGCGTERL